MKVNFSELKDKEIVSIRYKSPSTADILSPLLIFTFKSMQVQPYILMPKNLKVDKIEFITNMHSNFDCMYNKKIKKVTLHCNSLISCNYKKCFEFQIDTDDGDFRFLGIVENILEFKPDNLEFKPFLEKENTFSGLGRTLEILSKDLKNI